MMRCHTLLSLRAHPELHEAIDKRRLCDISPPNKAAFSRCSNKQAQVHMKKISLAKFSFGSTLSARAESVRFQKGEPNGLESTKNRRSAGRHGNQYVYVRYPQISGERSFYVTQVDLRA
jgi:hypothetical protein